MTTHEALAVLDAAEFVAFCALVDGMTSPERGRIATLRDEWRAARAAQLQARAKWIALVDEGIARMQPRPAAGSYVQIGRESTWGTPGSATVEVVPPAPVVGVTCAKCDGAGWIEGGHDVVPYGSTTASMPIAEPCDALPNGVCHGCGRDDEALNDDQRCAACGDVPS